jgi:xanthine/uracil permease
MSMAMLGIAIYTLLQATRRGPIGSACLVAAAKGGMARVAGMILVSGLAECGLARIVGKLRKIFPAVVSRPIFSPVSASFEAALATWSPDNNPQYIPRFILHLAVAAARSPIPWAAVAYALGNHSRA